jgi:hypothetical protein
LRSLAGGLDEVPGHEGHKRALTADPDQVVEHRPASCSACGEPLPTDHLIRISRQRPLVALVTGLGPARPGLLAPLLAVARRRDEPQ